MDQVNGDPLNRLASEAKAGCAAALEGGILFFDAAGEIVWSDAQTGRTLDGQAERLLAQAQEAGIAAIACKLFPLETEVNGERRRFCIVQQVEETESSQSFLHALETVMADSSWFTRAIVERLKAFVQATRPRSTSSDLELLTDREREVLALICDGKTDVEMSRHLGVSRNTVRNHIASLYRKIGVNRRSAAIIWARERAITSQHVLMVRRHKRPQRPLA